MDVQNVNLQTALHLAVERQHTQIVRVRILRRPLLIAVHWYLLPCTQCGWCRLTQFCMGYDLLNISVILQSPLRLLHAIF